MSRLTSLRAQLDLRPWWMNVMFAFCLYMTFIYLPFDLFIKPVEEDAEVWFGYMFVGWAAKVAAIPHWVVYGFGAYGFWKMKHWMWPWAALYCLQVVVAMVLWNIMNLDALGAAGFLGAAISGFIFLIPTVALWRARALFPVT